MTRMLTAISLVSNRAIWGLILPSSHAVTDSYTLNLRLDICKLRNFNKINVEKKIKDPEIVNEPVYKILWNIQCTKISLLLSIAILYITVTVKL